MELKEFLKLVSETPGLSGYEGPVARLVEEEFGRYGDQVTRDALGNVVVLKRGRPWDPPGKAPGEGGPEKGGPGKGMPGPGGQEKESPGKDSPPGPGGQEKESPGKDSPPGPGDMVQELEKRLPPEPGLHWQEGRAGAPGEAPLKVMLAAHMDEIGLMVSRIEEGGFLGVSFVGGIDPRTLLGQEVIIHGREDYPGIIGATPPHILEPEELEKGVEMEKLYVDPGMPEGQLRERVQVGDLVSIRREMVSLGGDFVAGKAMDDRAGVAVIYCCLQELQYLNHQADVYAVATVQEEVGRRGAVVSAYGVHPQVGIAIDVTHGEIPGVPSHKTSPLGKGTAICVGPNIHPVVYQRLVDLAEEYNVPYSVEVAPGPTGTDAWALQVSRWGIATGLVSIPLRYMHTSVEVLSLGDIQASARLLARFIASLDSSFVEELVKCY